MNEILSYEALKNHLLSISDVKKRALFCTIYAAMAREGEIVRSRYSHDKGLLASDVHSFDNRIELVVRSEKTRRTVYSNKFKKSAEQGHVVNVGRRIRKVPIFRNREQWLCRIVEDWVKAVGSGQLFPVSTRTAERWFSEWFPDFVSRRSGVGESAHTIHWLRGWRYTHYRRGSVTGRPVESKVASLLGGWVSSAVPERYYDYSRIEDFSEELENK